MSRVAVLAKLTALPGRRDDLVAALRPLLDEVEKEAGTLTYVMHTVAAEPDVVWFYELYSDAGALGAHSTSDTMKAVGAQLKDLVTGRTEIILATPVAGKGADLS